MPEFIQPTTLQQALDLLREKQNVKFLAGGTDLIIQMREKLVRPACLMDVKKIPELQVFGYSAEGLEIGAAVTCNQILDATLQPAHEVLKQAAGTLANTLLRNRATMVGNICNASPGGDMIPAGLVLQAKLVTASPSGGRVIPLKDFFTGVKKHVLAPDELIVKIVLPMTEGRGVYLKKQRIRGHDLAQVGVAGFYAAGGALTLAYAAVGPTPILLEDLGTYTLADLASKKEALLDKCEQRVSPIGDVRSSKEYRLAMVRYLTGKVLDTFSTAEEVGA